MITFTLPGWLLSCYRGELPGCQEMMMTKLGKESEGKKLICYGTIQYSVIAVMIQFETPNGYVTKVVQSLGQAYY